MGINAVKPKLKSKTLGTKATFKGTLKRFKLSSFQFFDLNKIRRSETKRLELEEMSRGHLRKEQNINQHIERTGEVQRKHGSL